MQGESLELLVGIEARNESRVGFVGLPGGDCLLNLGEFAVEAAKRVWAALNADDTRVSYVPGTAFTTFQMGLAQYLIVTSAALLCGMVVEY